MGMDASVKIFVGVKGSDCDTEELIAKLPKDMLNRNGELLYGFFEQGKIAISKYGCLPETIYDENGSHLGIIVFSSEWGDPERFDSEEVQSKIAAAKVNLQKLFDSCGITEEIGVWCHCNYS